MKTPLEEKLEDLEIELEQLEDQLDRADGYGEIHRLRDQIKTLTVRINRLVKKVELERSRDSAARTN